MQTYEPAHFSIRIRRTSRLNFTFYNAHVVNDRFHVQQIYNEAVDEIRIDIRRQLIAEDNNRDRSVPAPVYSNGETMRQILARSKHTLMMSQHKWTDIQRHRVNILFKYHPILRSVYNLAMELRQIFNAKISPTKAMGRMNKWYEKVMSLGNNNFRSVIKTFKNHAPTILNYFRRRATNASAEAFNSKVKIFRSQMRGGRIVKYLCLSVKIAKSKNEKFSVVYAMQFGSESFNL